MTSPLSEASPKEGRLGRDEAERRPGIFRPAALPMLPKKRNAVLAVPLNFDVRLERRGGGRGDESMTHYVHEQGDQRETAGGVEEDTVRGLLRSTLTCPSHILFSTR